MGIGQFLAKIPWKIIMTEGPAIVDSATKLMKNMQKQSPSTVIDLPSQPAIHNTLDKQEIIAMQEQIDLLIANEKAQAELVAQMAVQIKELTKALKIVSSQLKILGGIAVAAGLISVGAIILTLAGTQL